METGSIYNLHTDSDGNVVKVGTMSGHMDADGGLGFLYGMSETPVIDEYNQALKEYMTFSQFANLDLSEKAPDTSDAMKRYRAGKAGFTDKAHLKAKGLIPRSDGTKRKSDKYK